MNQEIQQLTKHIFEIKDGFIEEWGAAEISEFLKKLGLSECIKYLSGVEYNAFLRIDDFESLGIPSKYIDELKYIQKHMDPGNFQTIRKKSPKKKKKVDPDDDN